MYYFKSLERPISNSELSEIEKKIFESMIPQIRFDIINISIYLTIKNECLNVNSPFFDDLYTLYRLGYIPCGYAKGKYKVL